MLKTLQRGTCQETIKSRVNSFPRLRELETINSRFNYVSGYADKPSMQTIKSRLNCFQLFPLLCFHG